MMLGFDNVDTYQIRGNQIDRSTERQTSLHQIPKYKDVCAQNLPQFAMACNQLSYDFTKCS